MNTGTRSWRYQVTKYLRALYGDKVTPAQIERFHQLVEQQRVTRKAAAEKWDAGDIVLITYGDSVLGAGKPLETLQDFLKEKTGNLFSTVHILPFFPYSSDDGFSVIDYEQVNPRLGSWEDIRALDKDYDLMFDLVVNHISQQSEWFRQFKAGEAPGRDFFIEIPEGTDLSAVVRPRTSPLATPVETSGGKKYVWTTFSADQIDLDFSNPDLLYEMTRILLVYIGKGARIIRMDAIAYIWKRLGSSCIHEPEVHTLVKFFRLLAEQVHPGAIILTETNVPHKENISYFGDDDEAHMVYQFSLPPLLLHGLFTGSSGYLNAWARELPGLSPRQTFFNFTASHDGIGVRPLEGLVPAGELDELANAVKQEGGYVSYKKNADGSESPYELNITYFHAMFRTRKGKDKYARQRFLASQALMLAMQGVPAVYIQSLLGGTNAYEEVETTGRSRSINRKRWDIDELNSLLGNPLSDTAMIMNELKKLMALRKEQQAFHPNAAQEIVDLGNACFAFLRSQDAGRILVVANLTQSVVARNIAELGLPAFQQTAKELITDENIAMQANLMLEPYQVVWLYAEDWS